MLVSAVRPVGPDSLRDSSGHHESVEIPSGGLPGVAPGPMVYLYQEVQYMAAMVPGHTGIPSVWNNGVEFAFHTERYSDDAVVPCRR